MYTAYVLAIFLAAAATANTTNECFAEHNHSIPISSTCANKGTLADCFSNIERYEKEHLQGCYEEAGCSPEDAEKEVALAMKRCQGTSEHHELRRQDSQATSDEVAQTADANASNSQASSADATQTESSSATSVSVAASSQAASSDVSTAASSAATVASTTLVSSTIFSSTTASSTIISSTTTTTTIQTGPVFSDEACFETTKSWKNICDLDVVGVNTKTITCEWGEVTSSSCWSSMICTTNSRGDICMVTKGIDTDGIVIAIVLATLLVMLFGGVCLASALEDRKQKRLAARAEALAIARAASVKEAMLSDY